MLQCYLKFAAGIQVCLRRQGNAHVDCTRVTWCNRAKDDSLHFTLCVFFLAVNTTNFLISMSLKTAYSLPSRMLAKFLVHAEVPGKVSMSLSKSRL